LFTHNAKWQREGFASNLTLVINLYHWVAKGQLFHDDAIFFPVLKSEKSDREF